jgi:hypothetical protein
MFETYLDVKTPVAVGRKPAAEVLVLPPSVGGVKEITDYIGLFDYDLNLIVAAARRTGTR